MFLLHIQRNVSRFFVKCHRRHYSLTHGHKILFAMSNAYFRYTSVDNQLQISFRYQNEEFKIDRDFNFNRNASEMIDLCLDRMKTNIEKEFTKRSKKKNSKKQPDYVEPVQKAPEICVKLLRDGVPLTNMSFSDLLKDFEASRDISLKILEEHFQICYNQPWVIAVTLPSSILANFSIYPNKMDIQFGNMAGSKGTWSRGKMQPPSNNINLIEWAKCGEGIAYTTTTEDIGHYLKFELTPGNGKEYGPAIEAISKNPVQAGPGICPFDERHNFTKSRLSGRSFRVMSYNLLADLYADSDYSRTQLFPYCPPYALAMDYRKQLFMKEIIGYNADIMCFQEVDAKIFNYDLSPILTSFFPYKGNFTQKGSTGEGLSVFYNADRFELVDVRDLQIGPNIASLDEFEDLWEKIRTNLLLAKRITERSTALHISILRSKDTGKYLVVANTHLYFHPDADHIRLLQVGFAMKYVESVRKQVMEKLEVSNDDISIIFCGDFNSVPECGIYKLMTEQFVDENFIDWTSNVEEAVKGVTLSQPFKLGSATGCPPYTNFTHLFAACLDYIFYQTDNISVEEVNPLPSEEQLRAHIAIPSVVFPSDHVALVADLKFR